MGSSSLTRDQTQAPALEAWFLGHWTTRKFLHWVSVAALRLSLVAVSGGYSSLRCPDFSLRWLLLLQSVGFRHLGFSNCDARACGLFPDQGLNLCPLHWQVGSQPLDHQGRPCLCINRKIPFFKLGAQPSKKKMTFPNLP